MKLLRKLFAAKKRNQKKVKYLVGLHSAAMTNAKPAVRSRKQSYSWWGGQWHFSWTASKYFIYGNFNVPILFKLKTTVVKNSRRLFSMSSYVLAMASSCYGSVNSKPTHLPRAFVGFLSFLFGRPANAPQRGRAVHLKKNTHTHTEAWKSVQMPTPGQYQNFIFL